jgi:hypothetical protein
LFTIFNAYEQLDVRKDSILCIKNNELSMANSEKYNFKATETLHQIIWKLTNKAISKPESSKVGEKAKKLKMPKSAFEKINADIEALKIRVRTEVISQYLGEQHKYQLILATKNKQFQDLRKDLNEKWAENTTLKIRAKARTIPYLLFEEKFKWAQQDIDTKIPDHQWFWNIWNKNISFDDPNDSTLDTLGPWCEDPDNHEEQPKFVDEPWKTISDIQNNLKNVDIENKALHQYISTFKIEEKFSEEVIMSSDVVQKLLKQGVVLLKHTESLTAELDKEKAEQLNLKEKYIEDIKQLEEQNKEIQLTFKNKINELTDNYLKMVSEKENLEQMYVEVKSAETQLTELLDNIKEYQKVAEENTKEKEILKKKYSDLKKQYEELLEKKTKLGFDNTEYTLDESNSTEIQIKYLKLEINRLETWVESYKTRWHTLESELESLTNINNSLSTQKIKIIQKLDTYAHNQSKFIKASTKSSKLHKITQLEKENYLKWAQSKDAEIVSLTSSLQLYLIKIGKLEGQLL